MGAFAGACAYAVNGFSMVPLLLWHTPTELVILLVMTLFASPAAFIGTLPLRLAKGRWLFFGISSIIAVPVAVMLFEIYMDALLPAINWRRGWFLPFAAVTFTLLIDLALDRWRRFSVKG